MANYNEFHIGDGKTAKIYSLNCPFPVRIDVKQNGMVLTRVEPFRYSDKKKLIDQAKKKGHDIDVYPMTFSAPETCPRCNSKGVPSFQKKIENETESQDDSWWLKYYHKDEKKTCWIHKYVGNMSTFQQNQNKMLFESNLLSHAIKVIKKEYFENVLGKSG